MEADSVELFSVKGQSAQAQAERLAKRQCPIHGSPLSQAGGYYRNRSPVGCTRRDCDFIGMLYEGGITKPTKLQRQRVSIGGWY